MRGQNFRRREIGGSVDRGPRAAGSKSVSSADKILRRFRRGTQIQGSAAEELAGPKCRNFTILSKTPRSWHPLAVIDSSENSPVPAGATAAERRWQLGSKAAGAAGPGMSEARVSPLGRENGLVPDAAHLEKPRRAASAFLSCGAGPGLDTHTLPAGTGGLPRPVHGDQWTLSSGCGRWPQHREPLSDSRALLHRQPVPWRLEGGADRNDPSVGFRRRQ